MTDWIRPDCETAACIEYQIIGESVTIRDSATPEHPGLVFTLAEWEAFVGGLVAERIAEQAPKGLQRHAAHLGDDPIGEFYLADEADLHFAALTADRDRLEDQAGTLAAQLHATEEERDRFLEQRTASHSRLLDVLDKLAEANKITEQATRLASQRAEDLARAAGNAAAHITEALDQRDAAIAEREVLRHRDRRTQAVVEAAVGLMAGFAARKPGGGSDELCALEWAVDDYQKGPSAPQEPPQSPEQPPVEDTATDGLEAQGGAQQAAEAIPCTCDGGECDCPCHDPTPEARAERLAAPTAADLQAARDQTRADADELLRKPVCNCAWNDGNAPAHIVGHHADCPAWVPRPGSLGSDPRPRKRAAADNDQDPDDIDRALARQETRRNRPPLCPECGPGYRYGDEGCRHTPRTEGLDAAIEAACKAAWDDSHLSFGEDGWDKALPSERAAYRNAMTVAVRAASPLIEAAALHAAADRLRAMCADPTDLLTAKPGDARVVINVSLWLDDEADPATQVGGDS